MCIVKSHSQECVHSINKTWRQIQACIGSVISDIIINNFFQPFAAYSQCWSTILSNAALCLNGSFALKIPRLHLFVLLVRYSLSHEAYIHLNNILRIHFLHLVILLSSQTWQKFILAGKYWKVLGLTEVSVRRLMQLLTTMQTVLNCSYITQFVIFTKKQILHILYYQKNIHFWVCIEILNFNTLGENSPWVEQRRGSVHNSDQVQLVTMV